MTEKKRLLGRATRCPSCNEEIRFAWLTGMSGPHVHFYADDSNDVLIRAAWFESLKVLMDRGEPDSVILAEINALLEGHSLSSAKKYSVWSNVKCPKCRNEFPYRFKENLKLRLEDTGIVLIEGCELDTDSGVFLVEVECQS